VVSILTLASSKDSPDGTTVKVTLLKNLPFQEVCPILEVGRNLLDTSILRMWKCISVPATGRSASKVPIPPIFLP
jgi:hypothetical protein